MPEISQNIVYCANGHYYDANKHSACPFCQGQTSGQFKPTEDPYGRAGAQFTTTDLHSAPRSVGKMSDTIDPYAGRRGVTPDWEVVPDFEDSDVTRPPKDGDVTQPVNKGTPDGMPSPVVGWLVAVDGPNRGADYRIRVGYNYIGRKRGDICIAGDMTISGEKDSSITFVQQTNKFYVAHEQGKNVLLVNDIPVTGGGTEVHNYDRITIGNTNLLFVGLCGEAFSWEGRKGNEHV